MTRVIFIDEQVRAWLESHAGEDDTHNRVLRRILGLDPDGDAAPGDRAAPDAADPLNAVTRDHPRPVAAISPAATGRPTGSEAATEAVIMKEWSNPMGRNIRVDAQDYAWLEFYAHGFSDLPNRALRRIIGLDPAPNRRTAPPDRTGDRTAPDTANVPGSRRPSTR
ncbi:hypothetical protein ACFHW2_41175 [Actinomadura sp. LOL_016]|uniref:hypothetical protein n=1 Tax=unclassified Actinomadura TaxID=2626254 RepID=UPI003A809B53